ncbi:MAG TPA: HDOD domain-containing protein [Steroidobacteraceae bacterium]|nr:HDOD domain-containing protein [Steroidobacteraceae bacterium]
MTAALALLIGGVVACAIIIVAWMRKSRPKSPDADPIASTTGSSRTLTGASRTLTGSHPAAASDTMSWNEALRQLVAYALDDAPRQSLSQPPNPDHAPVFQAVQQILERIEARPEYIPRRPSLLPKLLATVNDNEATLAEMSQIIAQDPALTGNLLRIANSPLYRVSSLPIESIDRAVTLVGVRGIRAIIATALLQPVMTGGSGAYGRFPELVWEHTLYSAMAAEMHATQVEGAEPFVAQLCGLLYGLSAIVVFRIVRDQFAAQPHLAPDPGSMARLLESWVAPTAGRIAVSWELSQRVQYALESQTLAAELQMENSLGRSLKFGRVAASLIVLCRLGRVTEPEARAIIVAGEGRRAQIEKLWDRFANSYISPAK